MTDTDRLAALQAVRGAIGALHSAVESGERCSPLLHAVYAEGIAAYDVLAAGVTLDSRPDGVSDNQAALESLPDAVQAVDFNLPARVIVCEHGHYWRDYGDFLSMCPVSDDNLACSPQTVYARAEETP